MRGLNRPTMTRPFILLFLLLPFFAKAQEGFINHYDLDHPGMVFTNLLLHEDTLVASGMVIQDTFPYLALLSLAKLDTNGNVLVHYDYMDSLGANYSFGATPRGLLKCSDNSGYVMLGHAFERSTGLAMKIDNNGGQVWVKEYPDTWSQQDHYRMVIEVNDGYLIAGDKFAGGTANLFVKKIGYDGEGIWEKQYGTTNNRRDYFGDIFLLNDNEYIIGGSTAQNQDVPWQQATSTIRIFSIDSLGNEKWGWESEPSLEELWLRGLHINSNGDWIYSTVRGEFEPDGFMKRQPRVIVRDSDFEIVKAVDMAEFGGNLGNFFNDLVSLSDGGYLGVGSVRVPVDSPIVAIAHLRTWMSRMDMNGDTLWERKDLVFPDTLFATRQYLHSAVELPSGSIIAAGYYASYSDTKDWGVLIKVDKNGCVDTIYCSPITSTFAPSAPEVGEIKVYPNPASSVVHFDSPESGSWDRIAVFDYSGRMMKEESNTNQMDIGGLPAGVYFVRLWQFGRYKIKRIIKK